MSVMAKDKPKKNFPSRDLYKGTYLPKKLYAELEAFAKKEQRSVAFLVKRACEKELAELREQSEKES